MTEQVKCQFCKWEGAAEAMNKIAGHHVCDDCWGVILEIAESAMDAREAMHAYYGD